MTARIAVTIDYKMIDAQLKMLPSLMHATVAASAIRYALKPIVDHAKQAVQQPGKADYYRRWLGKRPAWKADKKPLRETITYKVIRYDSGIVCAVVGPAWPSGNHGHLLENGHRIAVKGTLRVATGKRKGYAPPVSRRAAARGHKTGEGIVRPWAPKSRAFPFMGPAVAAQKGEVQRRFVEKVRREVKRLWPA